MTCTLVDRRWPILLVLIGLGALSACDPDLAGGNDRAASTTTHTVGGSVSGLVSGGSVSLLDNNGEALAIMANGVFTFKTPLASGSAFVITVGTQPAGQTCTVAAGSGTIGSANVANTVITCSDQAFTLGGAISGLNGSGLMLTDGTDSISVIGGATSFTMPTPLAYTSGYEISVKTQPAGLACTVSKGTGSMPASNVTGVQVTCNDQPFGIGGGISGLGNQSGLVLTNGSDLLSVQANATSFTMPVKVNFGGAYSVVASAVPAGLTCSVAHGSGTMPAADVTNIVVSCSAQSVTVGGSISGLTAAGLVLANGSDSLAVSANATSFTMPTALAYGGAYLVTIQSRPNGQSCSISNAAGTIGSAPVTNITVTCAPLRTIGGTITGWSGASGLTLSNGTDTLNVMSNATTFTMPTAVATGATYDVLVSGNQSALDCSVTNGSGTVSSANVTNINVTCAPFTSSTLFALTVGQFPYGDLVQGSDGTLYGLTSYGGSASLGTVIAVQPTGGGSVLYSFGSTSGSDGSYPYGSLVFAPDGNLYGMTYNGGTSGNGTVFSITTSGVETVLYSFSGGADGSNPNGSLMLASDGSLYGMTENGGPAGAGEVFRLTGGAIAPVYGFGGSPDGALPYAALVQASDGNFYGTTYDGGPSNLGTIFQLTPSGTETLLYTFSGGVDGAHPGGNLVLGADGAFYGTVSNGGANGNGTIFRITTAGAFSVVYAFGPAPDGVNPYGSLLLARDGNFYGTTTGGGANNGGTVFKITPAGTEIVVYSFGASPTDGRYANGSLIQGADGALYGMTSDGGDVTCGCGTVFRLN